MDNMHRLLEIMAALRDPQSGCPWDRKQSFETIVPHTLEEAYEVADSIERGQMAELKDELGDLLFQVVFYAQLANEQGLFDFSDIVDAINDKLVRRHPHVFGGVDYENDTALNEAWEQSKQDEREKRSADDNVSVLQGIARALPALKRAQKLQKRAARVGFDWSSVQPVLAKIHEEIGELQQAIDSNDKQAQFEETGDLLFSCVNLSRHLQLDAEESLRACNAKFEQRFNYIEDTLRDTGREFGDCDIDTLEQLWQQAKDA
jgi:ATP diphosphatase